MKFLQFWQVTDRQVADDYGRARGSALESRAHLAKAAGEQIISEAELAVIGNKYTEISKMLTPWINYLQRSNWKIRGERPSTRRGPRDSAGGSGGSD